ncbi:glycosyltransferase [Aeromonas intestinalis]
MNKKKVVVFGTGGLYKYLKEIIFIQYDVLSIYDNDYTKKGTVVDGYTVSHIDDGLPEDYDYILVASMYFSEIKSQLIGLNVTDNQIKYIESDPLIGQVLWQSRKLIALDKRAAFREKIQGPLLIVINSLRSGGAERALVNLLRVLRDEGVIANVISIYGGGQYSRMICAPHNHIELFSSDEDIEARVLLRTISPGEIYESMLGLPFNTVIAFLEGPATLFCAHIPAENRIAWCHTDLGGYHWTKSFYYSDEDEGKCYSKFDELVFVSPSGLQGFCKLFPNVSVKKSIISNIFDIEQINNLATENVELPGSFNFVSVGRLTDIKGFDRLIDAFSKLCGILDGNVHLIIIGDGDARHRLSAQIDTLGLRERVTLVGFTDNPYKYINAADVYISSSHVEGQPLSIGEALILGKPVIATDNDGSNNILQKGEFGLLVENSTGGLLIGMLRAFRDDEFISEYTVRSRMSRKLFSHEKIICQFLKLIE